MTTAYAENNFSWQKARSVVHGLQCLENGSEGVEYTGIPVGEEDCKELSEKIRNVETCRALRLESCEMSPQAIKPLALVLSTDNVLCYLYLYGNEIGNEGASLIAGNIRSNTCLIYLSLSKNDIGDAGVKDLSETLKTNNTLRSLFLAKNEITDVGAGYLAGGLENNTGLMELVLSYNNIEAQGDISLAEMLKVNRSLTSLSIHQQEISQRGARALVDALAVNNKITFYGLGIYNTKKDIRKKATKYLRRNAEEQESRKSKMRESFTANLTDGTKARSVPWNRCKLMVVGQGRSGKTATVRALRGAVFTENLRSTVGANVVHLQTQQRTRHSKWRMVPRRRASFLTSMAARLSISQEMVQQHQQHNQKKVPNRRISLRRSRTRSRASSASSAGSRMHSVPRAVTRRVSNQRKKSERNKSNPRRLSVRSARLSSVHSVRSRNSLSRPNSMARSSSVASRASHTSASSLDTRSASYSISQENPTDVALPPIISKEEAEKLAVEDLFIQAQEEIEDRSVSFTIWDYGGQDVFYPLHHLFMSRYGIYTVVFSMRSYLEDQANALEYVKFWMHSIKTHAPSAPVFLVGTFLDKIPGTHNVIETMNRDLLKLVSKFPQTIHNQQQDLVFFPINNTKSETIRFFRASVEKAARAQTFVRKFVDLRWVGCLENMLACAEQGEHWIPFEKAQQIASNLGIQSSDNVGDMLRFFHEYGLLVYLTATYNLEKVITVNPQWLIDKICQVIRDTTLHKHDVTSLNVLGLDKDAERLSEFGIVSRDLLEYFWHKTQVDFLLDLMLQTMLLSEYQFTGEADYLVPSMITKTIDLWPSMNYATIIDFSETFLPQGVFERITCLLVGYSRETGAKQEPELVANQARFSVADESQFLIKKIGDEIEISSDRKAATTLLDKTEQIMHKICREVFNDGLQFATFLMNHEKNERFTKEEAAKQEIIPWFKEQGVRQKAKYSVDLNNFLST